MRQQPSARQVTAVEGDPGDEPALASYRGDLSELSLTSTIPKALLETAGKSRFEIAFDGPVPARPVPGGEL